MRLLQSLTRGLDTLDYLRASAAPARLTDVAAALGVDKSNAAHLLKTLLAAGYAVQNEQRRYLAAGFGAAGKQRERTLEEVVAVKEGWRSALERLTAETGECAHLAVLVGKRVWYIDKVASVLPLKVDHPIGSLAPLHCTALGKAFLAFASVEPSADLQRFTARTLTSLEALSKDLALARRRGFAVDDEEFTEGIRCVARPIHDETGAMTAAVGVSCPSVRVDSGRLAELGRLVLAISPDNDKSKEERP